MSDLAEFAHALHETGSGKNLRTLEPFKYPSNSEKLHEIRAVICDVYGTLINYWKPGFETPETREQVLLSAFEEIITRFGMFDTLKEINPAAAPQNTLRDFYHGLIALQHEKSLQKGVVYPEVKIEEVWDVIIMILKRRGYKPEKYSPGLTRDFSRFLAYSYNFHSLGRQLYPGTVSALEMLKAQNIVIGVLSNAQFYTPIDLTLLIREQSHGNIDDFNELFEVDLTFFSFEYGVAKPNQILFRKLYDALYEFEILPSQTVLVGNDLSSDIQPAIEAGMKTAFFTGDKTGAFLHDLSGKVIPDLSFQSWDELPQLVSFHSEENKE